MCYTRLLCLRNNYDNGKGDGDKIPETILSKYMHTHKINKYMLVNFVNNITENT